ncbi:hypothetical protein MRX96_017045 [Rhipicephalus microplus]
MFCDTSSGVGLLWQSQSDTPPVHQVRKPKATIALAVSLMLLLLVLACVGAALCPQRSGHPDGHSLHPAMARLFSPNFSVDEANGHAEADGGYQVIFD